MCAISLLPVSWPLNYKNKFQDVTKVLCVMSIYVKHLLLFQMWMNVMCRVPVSTTATTWLAPSYASVTRAMSWHKTRSPAKVDTHIIHTHTHKHTVYKHALPYTHHLFVYVCAYFLYRHWWMQLLQLHVSVSVYQQSRKLLLWVSRGISAPGKQVVSRYYSPPLSCPFSVYLFVYPSYPPLYFHTQQSSQVSPYLSLPSSSSPTLWS